MSEDDINPDAVKKIMNRLFSKEPLTKGELILIGVTIILIGLMLFMYFKTTCQLDCSMCEHTGQILTQRGLS